MGDSVMSLLVDAHIMESAQVVTIAQVERRWAIQRQWRHAEGCRRSAGAYTETGRRQRLGSFASADTGLLPIACRDSIAFAEARVLVAGYSQVTLNKIEWVSVNRQSNSGRHRACVLAHRRA